jgi:threonine dehydrogenase-like Zn-dependent dehydrogenase
MYEAGDVRIEDVPDPSIAEPTDAVIRVTRACICGSDLWPYGSLEPRETGRAMGHEAIGVVEDVGSQVTTIKKGEHEAIPASLPAFFRNIRIGGGPAPARACIEELLPDILEGRIEPGKVFDRTVDLDAVPDGYRTMADREAIKVMIKP